MSEPEKQIHCRFNRIAVHFDLSRLDFATPEIARAVHRFHQSIPGYQPTPLVNLSALSGKLGISGIRVKDESERFDLNAFKVLGASHAMARVLMSRLPRDQTELTFDAIASRKDSFGDITFVTATDGNHGRAVAWAAQKFGCRSVVYLPKGSSIARLSAIQKSGAEASITEFNYDDTVRLAQTMAGKNHWILLQDTSWKGYEEVPMVIMQGYFTLLHEVFLQEKEYAPTHVFVQAGVGSLAAGILAYLLKCTERPKPTFVTVEPDGAACLFKSIEMGDGHAHRISGNLETIMAGLACGEPSRIGWDVLKDGADAFIRCSDEVAERGMRILGNPMPGDRRVISGESGAVTLGLVYELLSDQRYGDIKEQLQLNRSARVLLFSTEGATDPEFYRQVLGSKRSI